MRKETANTASSPRIQLSQYAFISNAHEPQQNYLNANQSQVSLHNGIMRLQEVEILGEATSIGWNEHEMDGLQDQERETEVVLGQHLSASHEVIHNLLNPYRRKNYKHPGIVDYKLASPNQEYNTKHINRVNIDTLMLGSCFVLKSQHS